ncbi:MAG: ATP-binding protein [Burkholderiaceae bacterium]
MATDPDHRSRQLPASGNEMTSRPSSAVTHASDNAGGAAGRSRSSARPPGVTASLLVRLRGVRAAALGLALLLVCLVVFALVADLASAPRIDADWRADANRRIVLVATADPALQPHIGRTLTALGSGDVEVALDALALERTPRWMVDDGERQRRLALSVQMAAAFAQPPVTLRFDDGSRVDVRPTPTTIARLPIQLWLLTSFGLALFLVGAAVVLARPSTRNLVFAIMALCQAGNLLFIGIESATQWGTPTAYLRWNLPLRFGFDLITAAAMAHAACLHPRRLPGAQWIAAAVWTFTLAVVAGAGAGWLPAAWWWTQASVIVLGLAALGLLSWSCRIEPHPFAVMLRRLGVVTVVTWSLLTAAMAIDGHPAGTARDLADMGSMVWYVFLGSLLLLMPFLAKAQSALREFALLVAVGSTASSLALLFMAMFSIAQSVALALFVSLAGYGFVRQWILRPWPGNGSFTAERMFEQLYGIAREVEVHPERTTALLSQLLGELFEPLAVSVTDRRTPRTHVARDGSELLVPVPALAQAEDRSVGSLKLRFAQHGRRLFSVEDARLTDRIVEQLRRAVHFDRAVEQGRSEERLRLAQDLHDDIGARLLTLMYKAQSPEMEDYVRHTLQDLKTLTRGLAASNHRLSHAAAEWKSDLAHRLTAADLELKWTLAFDDDILLTVVHWSALTRIMRELVSNAIAHSHAQHLEVDFRLESDRLELLITDDGIGHNPRAWSQGLGLGGVRKRVKQLGGEVEWREVTPHGISCRVIIPGLSKH